mgnify:CR=1 FL=1
MLRVEVNATIDLISSQLFLYTDTKTENKSHGVSQPGRTSHLSSIAVTAAVPVAAAVIVTPSIIVTVTIPVSVITASPLPVIPSVTVVTAGLTVPASVSFSHSGRFVVCVPSRCALLPRVTCVTSVTCFTCRAGAGTRRA